MNDRHEHESDHGPTAPTKPGHEPFDATVDGAPPSPPISPADVGSASRSCLAILILGAVIVLVLCLAIGLRTLT